MYWKYIPKFQFHEVSHYDSPNLLGEQIGSTLPLQTPFTGEIKWVSQGPCRPLSDLLPPSPSTEEASNEINTSLPFKLEMLAKN